MAYRYLIDHDANCIFMEHFDGYELNEGIDGVFKVAEDPSFRHGMNILRDTRRVHLPEQQTFKYFREATKRLSGDTGNRFGNIRFAWVVGSAKDYANAHRWSVSARWGAGIERKPFRGIEAAFLWLDISEGYKISYT